MDRLSRIFPENCFLAPRVMEEMARWTPFADEGVSGALIGVAKGMDIICHRDACLPVTRSAIADSGLDLPANIHSYTTRAGYLDHMAQSIAAGQRAITTFPTPDGLFDDAAFLVAPGLQRWLNHRASLSALVPPEHMPPRRLVQGRDQIALALQTLSLPAVIKAADDAGSSGGAGVAIARAPRHRHRALRRFAECSAIIVEDFIPARANVCVQVAILPDGSSQLIGGSAQICSRGGLYMGSLAGPGIGLPTGSATLALTIAARAAGRGYRGIAGFDMLETPDGRLVVIDLNFRPNGSTPLLLTLARLAPERGLPFGRFAVCNSNDRLDKTLPRLAQAFAAGWLVLTGAFDDGIAPARLRLVVLAQDAQQLARRLGQLERAGLAILAPRRSPLARTRDRIMAWVHGRAIA